MPYQVTFERQARKYLAGLRDLKLLRRLREAPPELATDPRAPGCVKLQGEDELYRVVYQIQDAVLVVQIGYRREIYRQEVPRRRGIPPFAYVIVGKTRARRRFSPPSSPRLAM